MLVLVGIGKGKGETCDVSDVRVFLFVLSLLFSICWGNEGVTFVWIIRC